MFDSLSDRYIPQTVSVASSVPKPAPTKTNGAGANVPATQTKSQISVLSKPGSVIKLMNSARTYPNPSIQPFTARQNKVLQEVVADQWYKELMGVFRAAERAQQSVIECEERSLDERNHAERIISELNLTEGEVCAVMEDLVMSKH